MFSEHNKKSTRELNKEGMNEQKAELNKKIDEELDSHRQEIESELQSIGFSHDDIENFMVSLRREIQVKAYKELKERVEEIVLNRIKPQ